MKYQYDNLPVECNQRLGKCRNGEPEDRTLKDNVHDLEGCSKCLQNYYATSPSTTLASSCKQSFAYFSGAKISYECHVAKYQQMECTRHQC